MKENPIALSPDRRFLEVVPELSDADLAALAYKLQVEEVAAFERAERIRKQASAGRWTGSRSLFAEN